MGDASRGGRWLLMRGGGPSAERRPSVATRESTNSHSGQQKWSTSRGKIVVRAPGARDAVQQAKAAQRALTSLLTLSPHSLATHGRPQEALPSHSPRCYSQAGRRIPRRTRPRSARRLPRQGCVSALSPLTACPSDIAPLHPPHSTKDQGRPHRQSQDQAAVRQSPQKGGPVERAAERGECRAARRGAGGEAWGEGGGRGGAGGGKQAADEGCGVGRQEGERQGE